MADIVARDLADAPQTVLQSAAVYRKRQGGGVVVTAAVEALVRSPYQPQVPGIGAESIGPA